MTKEKRLGSDPLDWVGKDQETATKPEKPEPTPLSLHIDTNVKARADRFSITLTPELLERFIKLYDSWRLVVPGLQKKDLYNKMVSEFLERYEAPVRARATKALK